ncbi:MAG: GGDEF domain-containing protein [Dehalococcoidia bacterium]
MSPLRSLRVRRAALLSAGGLAVFLSYVAVMTGTATDATIGPVSIAAVAFPGLVTGLVLVAYVAWETRNVQAASHLAQELSTQLVRKEIEIGRISTVDELTRLYARREFENSMKVEFERRRRYGRDLSLLLLDVAYVSAAGEGTLPKTYLLSEMAAIFRDVLRANDIGGRYTPERLGLLLPETDEIRAQIVADKIRAAVARHPLFGALQDGSPRATVSIGIVIADYAFATCEEFAVAAETALAEAIAAGPNQVRMYTRAQPAHDESGPFRLAS